MEIKASLNTVLKRLRLSGVLSTLPERIAYVQGVKLDMADFIELVLQDEICREIAARGLSNPLIRLYPNLL